jgi:hypothetical protein
MYTRPASPQSIGGVLDDAVRLYRESFVKTLPLSIAANVAIALPSLLLSRPPDRAIPHDLQAVLQALLESISSPGYWLAYLICSLAYAAIYVALIVTVNEIASGRRADLPAALRKGVERLPSMLGAFILFGLMVGVGFILLVIPGIYLWGALQLTFFPLILDRERVGASIGISRRLVKGHWWRATTIISVIIVMSIVLEMIVAFLAALPIGLLRWQPQGGIAIVQIVNILTSSLVMALPVAGGLALYHDLRLRSDGSDLAARMETLAAH